MIKDESEFHVYAIVSEFTQTFWCTPNGKYLWTSRKGAANAWTYHNMISYKDRVAGRQPPKPEDFGLKIVRLVDFKFV